MRESRTGIGGHNSRLLARVEDVDAMSQGLSSRRFSLVDGQRAARPLEVATGAESTVVREHVCATRALDAVTQIGDW